MITPIFREYFESPAGWIEVSASNDNIISILFRGQITMGNVQASPLTNLCTDQLKAYFRGERKVFDIPVQPVGTPFQIEVWKLVSGVEYASTITYNEIAFKLGNPAAVRSVGRANGRNRLLIVIPCHRVIGADGSLVGYVGELWRKKWLLEQEARYSGKGQRTLGF
ncbi:MAG TPA: methylated-DNA--[protein]-cysteine S-methyltransferase [Chitinophagaceae bacterium]|nr:methylated-DNA--[protein]-cysteine S-methyltransferase [Chitinophagaceae bacterium]